MYNALLAVVAEGGQNVPPNYEGLPGRIAVTAAADPATTACCCCCFPGSFAAPLRVADVSLLCRGSAGAVAVPASSLNSGGFPPGAIAPVAVASAGWCCCSTG